MEQPAPCSLRASSASVGGASRACRQNLTESRVGVWYTIIYTWGTRYADPVLPVCPTLSGQPPIVSVSFYERVLRGTPGAQPTPASSQCAPRDRRAAGALCGVPAQLHGRLGQRGGGRPPGPPPAALPAPLIAAFRTSPGRNPCAARQYQHSVTGEQCPSKSLVGRPPDESDEVCMSFCNDARRATPLHPCARTVSLRARHNTVSHCTSSTFC